MSPTEALEELGAGPVTVDRLDQIFRALGWTEAHILPTATLWGPPERPNGPFFRLRDNGADGLAYGEQMAAIWNVHNWASSLPPDRRV